MKKQKHAHSRACRCMASLGQQRTLVPPMVPKFRFLFLLIKMAFEHERVVSRKCNICPSPNLSGWNVRVLKGLFDTVSKFDNGRLFFPGFQFHLHARFVASS